MPLLDSLQSDLNAARKAQDKPRTLVLGTILSDLKNRRIEMQKDLTDDDVVDVIRKSIKKRRESIDMFEKAARDDLVTKERSEITVLEPYLPAQVPDAELRAAVRAAIAGGAANIGSVMGKVMPLFKGRVDGSQINAIAREELGKPT